ncbi:isochorismate synthase [Anoxybacillus flavithermus]|uniref:Isochorismate synthase MenF n=1 Tax=Anoxybacillus flavithermus AK1 TaxID=1297581 RepID=M8DXU5_9BACL|nr:isochorismate synthase [Anoxybacillus flavithermus]EMT45569.1 menaquinone-specific isochorismate synthase [Anoxybacillus flavithermus AK1]
MVTLYQSKVIDQVRDALNKKRHMASVAVKIEQIDPLTFFEAGAKLFHGQRFYWSDCLREQTFVGLGHAYVIKSEDKTSERFREVEYAWKQMVEGAFIQGEGPLMFGGFAFDPMKRSAEHWDNFPSAQFVVPTFLLTKKQGETWLTVNVVHESLEQIEHMIDSLFAQHEEGEWGGSYVVKKEEVARDHWLHAVHHATRLIQHGVIEKVVLARELFLSFSERLNYAHVLRSLREQQPMSYIFAFENGSACFIGASPEQLVKKNEDICETACLAGSIRRGHTIKEDEELGRWLLRDEKNRHEHAFVVDMIERAMNEVCAEVIVPSEPVLLKMRHIQHLYTPVRAKVHDDVSIFSLVERLHPTPALGGFPKEKAVQTIREIEPLDRGWYAAPIGWVDAKGNGEFAVAIRSALLHDHEAHLFAGCGIVAHSNPRSEYEETNVKFKPMLLALEGK